MKNTSGLDYWWDILGVVNEENKGHKECSVCKRSAVEGVFTYRGVYGDELEIPSLEGSVCCSDECLEATITDALNHEHVFTVINELEVLKKKINTHTLEVDEMNETEGSSPGHTLSVFMAKLGSIESNLHDLSEAVRFLRDKFMTQEPS